MSMSTSSYGLIGACICICVFIGIYVYSYVYMHSSIHIGVHVSVYVYLHMYPYVHVHTYVFIHFQNNFPIGPQMKAPCELPAGGQEVAGRGALRSALAALLSRGPKALSERSLQTGSYWD